jgi:hypothetical protein
MAVMQEVKRRLTAVKGVRRRSRAQQKMAYLDVRKGLQIWQFVSSTDHFAGRSAKMAAEKPAKHRNRGPDDNGRGYCYRHVWPWLRGDVGSTSTPILIFIRRPSNTLSGTLVGFVRPLSVRR